MYFDYESLRLTLLFFILYFNWVWQVKYVSCFKVFVAKQLVGINGQSQK